ncbi:putative RNA-directed DNA polymerase [Helianthus annuus]|nr:putative RNA-directed DNA polymerase [Helianthus annuus]
MAEDKKLVIEKFDGSDFSWWKMQIEALLGQKDLDMVLEEKPEKMDKVEEVLWNAKDKKARGVITLSLRRGVAFNIMSETTARGMILALSNMYEKSSAANKVFLMRELLMMRMEEGSLVTEHINNLNSLLSRLLSVGMKFDNETKAVILLSSLPNSSFGMVTTVTNSVGPEGLAFEKMRDLVFGEDVCRMNTKGSSSKMLHVGRGRDNSRNSGSSKGRGRSSSRARPSVRCWDCNEKGHYRSQCPNKNSSGGSKNSNGLHTAAISDSKDEALIL